MSDTAIHTDDMMRPMLVACSSLKEQWEQFLNVWVDNPILLDDGLDGSLPIYLALSDLADHLIMKLETGDTKEFPAVFDVIELWITRGSHRVSEAAVVGLLEDLTNEARYHKNGVADFIPWMGPTTRKWLPEVNRFLEATGQGRVPPAFNRLRSAFEQLQTLRKPRIIIG